MKLLTRLLPFASFLPMLALAQANSAGPNLGYITGWVSKLASLINTLIPFILALALLVFLWGVFKYFVLGGGDEEKQAEGKKFMVYGIIGLVIMVAVWGIVALVANLFGLTPGTGPIDAPVIPAQR